jgi:hypothetical protein
LLQAGLVSAEQIGNLGRCLEAVGRSLDVQPGELLQ